MRALLKEATARETLPEQRDGYNALDCLGRSESNRAHEWNEAENRNLQTVW